MLPTFHIAAYAIHEADRMTALHLRRVDPARMRTRHYWRL
jgi:hypothetical protein